VADTIPSLFKGRMKSYVKCKEVAFASAREECFYDIQLNVKNKTNGLFFALLFGGVDLMIFQ